MITYPKCSRTFKEFYNNDKQLANKFVNKLMKIKLFDVSLRDGLQGLNENEQKEITTNNKIQIYNKIIKNYNPTNLEIGSCVNNKILPIFKDTEELFRHVEDSKQVFQREIEHYVLVPNEEQLKNALNFGVKNFSFITSVSNRFQLKNTKMLIRENLINLHKMMNILDDYSKSSVKVENCNILKPYNVKLYVSCINECPFEGKIPISNIVGELFSLNIFKFDRICLSDTCGTLSHSDFVNIINTTKKIGLDINKFSLHLHVKPERENEVEAIVHTALDYGITEFDVSYLQTGGCSITMDKNKLTPNMNYEQFYKFLTNYLLK
jgi:hydroxymethylglutaryl-CoA lyase